MVEPVKVHRDPNHEGNVGKTPGIVTSIGVIVPTTDSVREAVYRKTKLILNAHQLSE